MPCSEIIATARPTPASPIVLLQYDSPSSPELGIRKSNSPEDVFKTSPQPN